MENEKQLETIEEELKLLKGELKQSLVSVRDYLLNMELPTTEFSTILAALGDSSSDNTMNMKGTFQLPPDNQAEAEPPPAPEPEPEPEPKNEEPTPKPVEEKHEPDDSHLKESVELQAPRDEKEDDLAVDEALSPEETEAIVEEEPEMSEDIYQEEAPYVPDAELPLEEQLMDYPGHGNGIGQTVPKVNLLANLISWISVARREIGDDQLPAFLEVYGISGYLSPEMKDVILHLANITSERPEQNDMAEVWSNSMLSLHGILTGGDVPLNPVKPMWGSEIEEEEELIEEEIEEPEEPEEQPVKLKLVFPNGNGKGKEYCIDLAPEAKKEDAEL